MTITSIGTYNILCHKKACAEQRWISRNAQMVYTKCTEKFECTRNVQIYYDYGLWQILSVSMS